MMRTVWPFLGLLALALLLAPGRPQAQEDDLVPAGIWSVRITQTQRTEDRAISRLKMHGPLLGYLVPEPGVQDALSGSVTREVQRTDLTTTIGLTDAWNLVLGVPYTRIRQSSSLSSSDSNPAVQAEVERLQAREVSGTGSLRLASLHRPVFSDNHGFVWGYGLDVPRGEPASDWAGRGTLLTDPPFRRYFALWHYTYYPYVERGRFDLRMEVGLPRSEKIPVQGRGELPVHPGNDVSLFMGWRQEYGPVTTGYGLKLFRQGQSSIAGGKQGDKVVDYAARLELGYGNLTALEQGPIAFPYLLLLGYERTFRGYDTVIRDELQLSLRFYF